MATSDTKIGVVQTSGQSAAEERARISEVFEHWFEKTFHNRALPTALQNELSEARDWFRALLRGEGN